MHDFCIFVPRLKTHSNEETPFFSPFYGLGHPRTGPSFDDKTGDMRSCVNITEKNGTYYCEVIMLYEKDANGKYKVMQPPYAKEYEGVVGTQLFIDMKQDDDVLRGEVYDPESQKTYYGKVSYKAKTDELILRGSLDRAGWLGRSQTWKRKK